MTIVTAQQLSKTFPKADKPALNALDFSIETGKITGLVGPDGAGKTTLIRMLAGLLTPTSGKLEILGTLMPCTQSSLLQQIGYMPQKFGLYEDLSVDENLRLYASLQDVERPKERIQELLEFTSLLEFRTRKAGALSGGMKQKLGLACALIKKPKLLLLDEPGVGVDPISRINLWEMIQTLLKEDIAVLWGTSYLDEADKCDSVILLNDGIALYQGLPQKMKEPLVGEVYRVSDISSDKRRLLTHLLHAPDVMDAVLVGNTIRVNLKEGTSFPSAHLNEYDAKARVEVCAPTFEDAFVRLLGVKTEPESLLANQMTPKKEYQGYLIEAHNLTKTFGSFTATDHIDFKIGRGEIFGFLGPNGAGKSTTFKMLCGLMVPTKGTALVMGENLYTAGAKVRANIGYMAQKFSLYSTLNIINNLEFFAGIYGLSGKQYAQKIEDIIKTFDFKTHLETKAELLPLGIKQRLALACALMHEPSVLFLDEPTSGVDPITRKEFWTHINGIVKKGVSVMVTTHFMDEAEYCDRIMLIYHGKAIATGTPDELKHQVSTNATMEEAFIQLIHDYDAKVSL